MNTDTKFLIALMNTSARDIRNKLSDATVLRARAIVDTLDTQARNAKVRKLLGLLDQVCAERNL